MIRVDIRQPVGDFILDAAFEASKGVTAIFGPSGSGKTTLIKAVAGLLTPQTGQIVVGDRVLFDAGKGVNVPVQARRLGYVFQDSRLFPHMSVQDNLRYGGRHDEGLIVEMLGLSQLLSRMPAKLSGGERQRVALGRALMSDPEILLLDEPLAALDAPRKAEILPYLARLRDTVSVPMLYVSHDVSEVARLANQMVVLDGGRVATSGPVGKVLSSPDAVPLLGVRAAGAVIAAKVAGRLLDDDLTELSFSGGRLLLPGQFGSIGQKVRLRVPAQDVILATTKPRDLSALNVLPVTVAEVAQGKGPGVAVALRAGDDQLLARITKRSAARMNISVGQQVYAIIKATAVAPEDIGT